ncbi:MAG: peptide deformylase [Bacteroidales bacterium]|jgi:peptide deformylase|nr:peptide deformylase [Bacteroidales bacterium]
MIYPVVVYGHPVLRKVARDIDRDYPGLDPLVNDLFETMHASEGVGLAAPQIGKSVRIFVVDGTPLAEDDPEMDGFRMVFINARITEKSGEILPMNEGCLSIPNIREEVNRESYLRMTWYDDKWVFHDEVFTGYKARVIQHEYDHLDGVLFTDKVSPLRRRLLQRKLNDISKGRFEVSYKTILPGQRVR